MKESEHLAYIHDICSRLGWPMPWYERIKGRVKLRELHTLEAVLHSGSMAKAAGYLGLSQSAVSKIVRSPLQCGRRPYMTRSYRSASPTAVKCKPSGHRQFDGFFGSTISKYGLNVSKSENNWSTFLACPATLI